MEVKGIIPVLMPVPLTPIQIHSSTLPPPSLCLHNWLQAFGIHHISWNPICKRRTAATGRQSSLFLTCWYSPCTQSLEAEPVGKAFRVVPDTNLNHVGSDTLLCAFEYLQLHFTEEDACSASGWKAGDFSFFFFLRYFLLMRSITDGKTEEYNKGQRENKNK